MEVKSNQEKTTGLEIVAKGKIIDSLREGFGGYNESIKKNLYKIYIPFVIITTIIYGTDYIPLQGFTRDLDESFFGYEHRKNSISKSELMSFEKNINSIDAKTIKIDTIEAILKRHTSIQEPDDSKDIEGEGVAFTNLTVFLGLIIAWLAQGLYRTYKLYFYDTEQDSDIYENKIFTNYFLKRKIEFCKITQ